MSKQVLNLVKMMKITKVEKIRESLLTFLLKIIIQCGEFLCLKCSKSVMITWCPNKFWFGKIDENHKSWKIRESLFTFLINKNIPSIFWSKRSKNVSITRCPNKFCTWQKNLKKSSKFVYILPKRTLFNLTIFKSLKIT